MSIYSANSFNYPPQSGAFQPMMQPPRKTSNPETTNDAGDEATVASSQPRHRQLPPPPEGTNWLGYTAIAGGTGLVGGGIGFGYKRNLAFSDVELQAGWKKLHKAGDTVQKLHLDQTITIHHGLNSKNIENSGKLPEGVKLGDNIFGYHWLKPQDSEVYGFNLLEGDEKNCKYLFQVGLITEKKVIT